MSKDIVFKLLGLLVLFMGEFFAIYGELLASKYGWSQASLLIKPIIMAIIGGILLILGYVLCYAYFKNIWIVAVISITSIFIIEPILAWTMFHEIPTRGAILGLGFAILGALSSIFL